MRALLFVAIIIVLSFLDKQTNAGGVRGYRGNFQLHPDCFLPRETGRCRAYYLRYFYDSDTNTCKQFVYGGCDGNNNNFREQLQCMSRCVA